MGKIGGGGGVRGMDHKTRKGSSWVWFVERYLYGIGGF